jgi:DNA replication protein DnaC
MNTEELIVALKRLKLGYLSTNLEDFISQETKKRSSPRQMLERLAEVEIDDACRRSTASRLRQAKLGKYRPWADYDWGWPEEVPREAIDKLFTLNFLHEPANVIFVGTAGLGKTMCAKNLAYQAILAGHSALFVEAADMLADLSDQDSPRAFKTRLGRYLKPKLLVLDELGYLSYSTKSADIIFQVVSRRYEKASTIVTTNKAFKDWGTIFPGAACVNAMIDRLTHHAELIRITGKSYRKRESEHRKLEAETKATTKTKRDKQ